MIDYLLQNLWQVWAVLSVLFLILELTSGDFFIFCFAIGAAVTSVLASFLSGFGQLGVFAAVTTVSIFTVRPFALRYLHKQKHPRVSNADALIGRTGRVTQAIKAGDFGRVAIDGDDWKADSRATEELPVGMVVKVVDRQSIVITVAPLTDSEA